MTEMLVHTFLRYQIVYLLHYTLLCAAAYYLFPRRYSNRKTVFLLCLLTLFSYIAFVFLSDVPFLLKILVAIALQAAGWLVIFEESLGKLLFFCSVLFYETALCDFITASLAALAINGNLFTLPHLDTHLRLFAGLAAFFCMIVLVSVTAHYLKARPLEIPNRYWAVVDSVLLLCYYISLLVMGLNQFAPEAKYCVFTVLLCVLFPVLFFFILKMIIDLCSFFRQEKYTAVMQLANDALQKQLALQSKALHDLRKLQHDRKNHAQSLSALLAAGDSSAAINYLARLMPTIEGPPLSVYCASATINSILNAKMIEAAAVQARLSLSIDPDLNVCLPAMDITCILANLLDNAIEAVQKLDATQRTIQVQIGHYHGLVFFRVTNTYLGAIKVRGAVILSSKSSASSHGYGLELVRATAERNGGSLQINHENQTFVATAFVKE